MAAGRCRDLADDSLRFVDMIRTLSRMTKVGLPGSGSRVRRVVGVVVVAAAGVVAAVAPPTGIAAAQTGPREGTGATGYRDRNVWAGYSERPVEVVTPATGLPRNPTRFCLRLPLPNQEAPPTGQGSYTPAEMRDLARRTPLDLSPGAWHSLICYNVADDLPYLVTLAVWNPADPTAGNTTTIEAVEAFARDLIDTPAPTLVSSPPPGRQITGLETWFAAASAPTRARSAQAGPLWATAEAVASRVHLDAGDATPMIVCAIDASTAFAALIVPAVAPACLRHTYLRTDRRTGVTVATIRVRTVYDVFLISSDDAARRAVDSLTSEVAAVPITIREIQTVLR